MQQVRFSSVDLPQEVKYAAGLAQGLFGRLLRQSEVQLLLTAAGPFSLDAMIEAGMASPQFQGQIEALYGVPQPTNEAWVRGFTDHLYQNLFGREPDVEGQAYWVDAVVEGRLTIRDLVEGFVLSTEFESSVVPQIADWYNAFVAYGDQADQFVRAGSFAEGDVNYTSNGVYADFSAPTQEQINIAGLYQGLFGRLADSGGFHYWETVYASSGLGAVINGMFETPEFLAMYGQPNPQNKVWATNFTKLLYNDFFARKVLPEGGLDYWASRMVSGELTAQQVTQLFLESEEFQLRTTQPIKDWYQSFYAYGSGVLADEFVYAGSRSGYRPDHPDQKSVSKEYGINGVYGVHVELSTEALSGDIGPAYALLDPYALADQFSLVGVQGRNPVTGAPDPVLYPSTLDSNFKGGMVFDATDVQFITLSRLDANVTLHGTLDTQIRQKTPGDQTGDLLVVGGDSTGRLTVISADAEVDVAGYSGPASLLVNNLADTILHTGKGEATIVADGVNKLTIDADAGTAALDAGKIILKGTAEGDIEIVNLENDLTLSNVADGFGITGAVNITTSDVNGQLTVALGNSEGSRSINAKAMDDDGDKLVVTGSAANSLKASISNADFDSTGYLGDVDLTVCNAANETLNILTDGGDDSVAFDPSIVAANETPSIVKLLGDNTVVDLDGGSNRVRFDILNATGAGPAPGSIVLAGAGTVFAGLEDLTVRIDDDQSTVPNADIQVEADLDMMSGVNTLTLEAGHVALDVNDSDKGFLLRNYAGEDAAPAVSLRTDLIDDADYDHNTVDRLGVIAKNPGETLRLSLSSNTRASNMADIAIKTHIYDAGNGSAPVLDSLVIDVNDSHNRIIDLDNKGGANFDQSLFLHATDGNQTDGLHTTLTLLGVRAGTVVAEDVIRTDVDLFLADNSDHTVWLGGGSDTVHGSIHADNIMCGEGDDVVYAGLGNDIVYAGVGQDYIDGGEGGDQIFAGEENDTVVAGLGDDLVDGGLGADYIVLSDLIMPQTHCHNSDDDDDDDDHDASHVLNVVADGSDVLRYATGDQFSAQDSYLSVGQSTVDQVAGFDFSAQGDKFELSFLSANYQANSVCLNLDAEPLDVAQAIEDFMLVEGNNYMAAGETDALLLHVQWCGQNKVNVEKDFIIVNTDLLAGYQSGESGDLTIEILSSFNACSFSTQNFITNNLVV